MKTNRTSGWMEDLKSDHDGRRLLERERVWVEATENLCRLMEAQDVSRAELARRLGVSRAWVTQMLRGDRNLTLATLADAFFALGRSLHASYGPQTELVEIGDGPGMGGELGASDWPSVVRETSDLDPTSSRSAFLEAVRVEYARRFDESKRARHPLQRMRVGRKFLDHLRRLDGIRVAKVIEVCAQVACLRAHQVRARCVHELRNGADGSASRVRPSDRAVAWRCSLQKNTPSADHLLWWDIPAGEGRIIEFASVAAQGDLSIPR